MCSSEIKVNSDFTSWETRYTNWGRRHSTSVSAFVKHCGNIFETYRGWGLLILRGIVGCVFAFFVKN